jgi:hypothetical protein
VAISRDASRFCTLFDREDFEMFEYSSDLEDYWQRGYGNTLGHSISCPLLVDFMDKIDNVVNSPLKNPQRAFLRFAHAETIIPFVSLLVRPFLFPNVIFIQRECLKMNKS